MQQIIKNGQVVTDEWCLISENETDFIPLECKKYILPLAVWMGFYPHFTLFHEKPGLLLSSEIDLNQVRSAITEAPLIVIFFASFMDGTGFSTGSLLRETFNFKGELRAAGEILPDQMDYLSRCGFDAISFADLNALKQAEKMIQAREGDKAKSYQGDVQTPRTPFQQRFSKV